MRCNKQLHWPVKPKFHYADFLETYPSGEVLGEVGVMEVGLKGTSRVCRGRYGEVGIVEFGLKTTQLSDRVNITLSDGMTNV